MSRLSSTAALHSLEKEVLKSLPAVWGVFSTLVHDPDAARDCRAELHRDVDAFFADWASDQGPMPITKFEVHQLTMRAKRKWITARRRELKKRRARRATAPQGLQAVITRYLPPTRLDVASLLALRSSRHTASITRLTGRKRHRWVQQTLRDMGLQQDQCNLLAGPGPYTGTFSPKRTRRSRVAEPQEQPRLPNPSRTQARIPLDWRIPKAKERRRRLPTSHRRVPNTSPASQLDTTANTEVATTDSSVPDIRLPTSQEETQYAVYERPCG